ncbi:DNA-directed RNA polymerase, partial [Rhizophlyctis rosea]
TTLKPHTSRQFSAFALAESVGDDSAEAVLFPKSSSAAKTAATTASSSPSHLPSHLTHSQSTAVPTKPYFHPPTEDLYKIQDRIALIHASIDLGDLPRAEVVFHRALRQHSAAFTNQINVKTINAFIEGFLKQSNIDTAERWYGKIAELGMKPDVNTFVAFLKFGLRGGDVGVVEKFVGLMEANRVPVTEVIAHDWFLDKGERASFESILAQLGKPISSNSLPDDLLMSVMVDASSSSSSSSSTTTTTPRTPAPPLKSTTSLGVSVLQKALKDFENTASSDPHADRYHLQEWLEERAYEGAREEYDEEMQRLHPNLRHIVTRNTLTTQWFNALVPAIRNELTSMSESTDRATDPESNSYFTFLKLLTPEQLAKITISAFLKMPGGRGGGAGGKGGKEDGGVESGEGVGEMKSGRLCIEIGGAVETEWKMRKVRERRTEEMIKTDLGIHRLHTTGKLFSATLRNIVRSVQQKQSSAFSWTDSWPTTTKARIGAVLVSLMLKHALIVVEYPNPEYVEVKSDVSPLAKSLMDPLTTPTQKEKFIRKVEAAFKKVTMHIGGNKQLGVVIYHAALLEMLMRQRPYLEAWRLPMLVPPRPWLSWRKGGYLRHSSSMVRISPGVSKREAEAYLDEADARNNLTTVMRSLDVLGSTGWVINESVYEVAARCWNEGVEIKGLPRDWSGELRHVEKPREEVEVMTQGERSEYWRQLRRARNENSKRISERAEASYRLEIARAFLGHEIFFPHNLDFRGRAYPIPAHLNHMGNDLCRGLLTFSEKKPLGKDGVRWLKIHLANLSGNDKISFGDRVAFTEANLENVLDSAERPLDGTRWWMTVGGGEDPWQLLAACMELRNALAYPGGAEAYPSSLPIHQDGTCNGLQHYAALGGDEIGAQQVNLKTVEGSDKPGDVYTGVAEVLKGIVEEDAKKAEGEEGSEEAKMVLGRVNRKLVKQTVMTNTYGVTFVGARDQVRNRLREARSDVLKSGRGLGVGDVDPETGLKVLSDEEVGRCAIYVAKRLFEAMGRVFEGARGIQGWLNESARIIASYVYEYNLDRKT